MRHLTEGSITKAILKLSWPTMIAFSLQTAYNIVDTMFVGRLGPEAIAAVSIAFPVIILQFALGGGLAVGTTSLIARSLGAKDNHKANNAAEHAYLLAVCYSLFFTAFGFIFGKHLFAFMGASGNLMALTSQYSNWLFAGSIFMFLLMVSGSILRGEGNMKTPMVYMLVSVLLNVVLDPIFIFGFGIIPAMGVQGAAIATFLAQLIGCVLMLGYMAKGKAVVKIKPADFKLNFLYIRQILAVGIPSSLTQIIGTSALIAVTSIVARFGPEAIAAYGIGFKLDAVAFLPSFGIMMAVITLVGHNIGAKKHERAVETTWKAAIITMLIMECFGVLFFLFPEFWIGLFNTDPALVAFGVSYLRTVSLTYAFQGIMVITMSAFQGSGRAIPFLAVNASRAAALVLLSFLLSSLFATNGIWAAQAITTVIAGIAAASWFSMSRFKHAVPA